MKSAIVLCSGGLDSVITSYYVKKRLHYDKIGILFFNYGQKTLNAERKCAKNCAKNLIANFIEIKINFLRNISESITNKNKSKKVSLKNLKNSKSESDSWYFPCRNLIFLSFASALSEYFYTKNRARVNIFVGFKCEGKESYPDTTKEFASLFNNLIKKSTKGKFNVIAPLIEKDKEDIILLGKELSVNFKDTFSCYASSNKHCGHCLACRLRQEGFYWANLKDPTKYKEKMKDFRTA